MALLYKMDWATHCFSTLCVLFHFLRNAISPEQVFPCCRVLITSPVRQAAARSVWPPDSVHRCHKYYYLPIMGSLSNYTLTIGSIPVLWLSKLSASEHNPSGSFPGRWHHKTQPKLTWRTLPSIPWVEYLLVNICTTYYYHFLCLDSLSLISPCN